MKQVKKVAADDSVSVNQFILSAVAEKTATVASEKFFAERAGKGNATAFARVLSKVKNRPPVLGDELPRSRSATRRPRRSGP